MSSAPEHKLSKLEYETIRGQLVFQPSPAWTLLTLAVNAALLAIALHLLMLPSRLAYAAAQLLLPIVFFQAFSILHDCGHGSFASTRYLNTIVGHYASLFCFMPFYPWKYIHTEHHVWAGNVERDPGLALVKRARDTGKLPGVLNWAWRSWFPLAGFAQHIVYWSYPLTARRRGVLTGQRLWRSVFSVALLLGWYAGLQAFFPNIVNVVHFGPAILLYAMLVELVNIPHHVGLTSYDQRLPLWSQHLPTRSCNYPPLVSELVVLNFNFHIEHHLFPTLPWYRLRRARCLVKSALADRYREATGFGWHVQRRRSPFTGVLLTRE